MLKIYASLFHFSVYNWPDAQIVPTYLVIHWHQYIQYIIGIEVSINWTIRNAFIISQYIIY